MAQAPFEHLKISASELSPPPLISHRSSGLAAKAVHIRRLEHEDGEAVDVEETRRLVGRRSSLAFLWCSTQDFVLFPEPLPVDPKEYYRNEKDQDRSLRPDLQPERPVSRRKRKPTANVQSRDNGGLTQSTNFGQDSATMLSFGGLLPPPPTPCISRLPTPDLPAPNAAFFCDCCFPSLPPERCTFHGNPLRQPRLVDQEAVARPKGL